MRSILATTASAASGKASRGWKQFWFAPVSAYNFALFRTGLGLVAFNWFVTLVPDFGAFFGPESLALDSGQPREWFTLFQRFNAGSFLWVTLALGLAASGTLLFGKLTRLGGPALAVLIPSTMAQNQLIWNAGDDLLQTLSLLFGLYCLLTPSCDLDIPLQLDDSISESRMLSKGCSWFFQLVKIQMTIVYFVAFIKKIPGEMWRDGTASMIVFRLETLERFPTPALLENNLFVGNAFTWSSLALEGLLPFLLWRRTTRSYAIAAGAAFHIMIDWSLAIGLFSWIMILGLTAFLPSNTGGWLRSLGYRINSVRRGRVSSVVN